MIPLRLRPAPTTVAVLSALLPAIPLAAAESTALHDYVRAPDSHFAWKQAGETNAGGFRVTRLDLTSQKWREHVWHHTVQVVRPPEVRHPGIAFLFVTGDGDGRNNLGLLRLLAERAGAVAAVVTRVPNQPLYGGKNEDALIAYTFDQFLKTGDATWPLLYPMTKSAVRAMDAVAAFSRTQGLTVTNFVVGGASKRGWTTWLTAAADPRVAGIAPMVFDALNMKSQVEWAEKVYGRQSEKIHDYTDLNLHLKLDEPRIVELRAGVDPYSYRQRYTLPKLLLLGTNDRYWTVDSLRHYWEALPGPKLVFQTPNAGHDLGDRKDAMQTLAAFFEMIADGRPLPRVTWEFRGDGGTELAMEAASTVKGFRLWTCDSEDRDFRDETWTSRELPSAPASRAVGRVNAPASGYRALMGEALLTTPRGHAFKLSTQVRVVPDNIK